MWSHRTLQILLLDNNFLVPKKKKKKEKETGFALVGVTTPRFAFMKGYRSIRQHSNLLTSANLPYQLC